MADRCKYWADKYDMNISVLATPAEGLSGKFVKKDRADFGVIHNVTDRDYYTNSNHVPVWYKCTMEEKMRIEAPYHPLTPAGHIAYLEVDGDPEKNVKAVEQMVNLMRKHNVGYGSINHARARCLDCGYESGSDLFDTCPECGSTNVDMLERITGYLVGGTGKWNAGKKAELSDRVSHMSGEKMVKDKQI
jgi:ribonucleoside-triphosphate reductase